jgi:transcription antitermination factor NusA-like protein
MLRRCVRMKWLLLVSVDCVAIAILLIVVHRWKSVDPLSAAQRAFDEGLRTRQEHASRDEPLSAAQRAFDEGLDADDADTAIAKFTEAIRLQPDGAVAYLHRGDCSTNKDDLDRAVADFSKAICLKPNFAEAYHARGGAYDIQGQSEKAKTDFQRFDELSDPEAVRQLFKKHIPEIAGGVVEIKGVARIGGMRTKIAVYTPNPRIDAVGSCVHGIKNIVDELGGERIDIVRWSESLQVLVPNALQPAEIDAVMLCHLLGRAIVVVRHDQLSPAIGQRGQNVRLASKLVGWDIELVTAEELDELIEKAVKAFEKIEAVDTELAERLVEQGILSYDDLTFVETAQLAGLAGVTEEQAAAMILFAKRAVARIEQQEARRRGLRKR